MIKTRLTRLYWLALFEIWRKKPSKRKVLEKEKKMHNWGDRNNGISWICEWPFINVFVVDATERLLQALTARSCVKRGKKWSHSFAFLKQFPFAKFPIQCSKCVIVSWTKNLKVKLDSYNTITWGQKLLDFFCLDSVKFFLFVVHFLIDSLTNKCSFYVSCYCWKNQQIRSLNFKDK
jgi:hypothetical protein